MLDRQGVGRCGIAKRAAKNSHHRKNAFAVECATIPLGQYDIVKYVAKFSSQAKSDSVARLATANGSTNTLKAGLGSNQAPRPGTRARAIKQDQSIGTRKGGGASIKQAI